jgi:hypothetical protein
MALIDNRNGTLTDTATRLMWQSEDDGVERDQAEAFLYCQALSYGGFSDWRLPTLDEFTRLLSSAKEGGVVGSVNTVYNRTTDADYWTSTQGPQANVAYIADGTTMFKTNKYCVRAVRASH